jgi:hypothetical protein
MSLKMELEDLQYRLGEMDLLTRPSRSGGKNLIEFLVVELEDIAIKIRMDGDRNHARPHIHIDYGKKRHAASYAIDNGERLAGQLDRKYDREIADWIEEYRPQFLKVWTETQAGRSAEVIVCEIREKTAKDSG